MSLPQYTSLSLCVRHHTMANKSFTIILQHLLLPGFSLARTRSIFISIHQARDKVRCYCYDKCIRNNRENSDAFQNSIPNSYSNRNVVLVPPEVVRMKNNKADLPLIVLFIFPNASGNKELEFVFPNSLELKEFLWFHACANVLAAYWSTPDISQRILANRTFKCHLVRSAHSVKPLTDWKLLSGPDQVPSVHLCGLSLMHWPKPMSKHLLHLEGQRPL